MRKLDFLPLRFLIGLIVLGQLIFALSSIKYTAPRYESKVFSTLGIKFDGADLHKLNEGAHYFGQTMIGWTKFPNFRQELIDNVELPDSIELNMHAQERQNFVFTITTPEPIDYNKLTDVKDFLQSKVDLYNANTNTKFVLSNVDYEQAEITRSYAFGALFTLLLSGAIGLALLFIRKEFFPPKLKL